MRAKRGATNRDDIERGDIGDGMLYPDGTRALLYPPSKFLSPEEDKKVQENVLTTMKTISGSRLGQFRGLGYIFVPNTVKDPTLRDATIQI